MGGTIAGAQVSATNYSYKAGAYDVSSLISTVPNLEKLAQVADIPRQDMNNEIWLKWHPDARNARVERRAPRHSGSLSFLRNAL